MKKRLLTGAILILILAMFIGLRQFNIYFFDIFIGIITIFSSAEVSRVFIRSHHFNNMSLVTIFPVFYYLGFMFSLQKQLNFGLFFLTELVILLVFVLICLIWTLLDRKSIKIEQESKTFKKYVLNKVGLTSFIYIYPTMLLGLLFTFNHAVDIGWFSELISNNLGLFLILILFAITTFTDTFAYFVGSALKGPKLCPLISPKKTISGAIGGLLGGIIASLIGFAIVSSINDFNSFFMLKNIQVWHFLILGFVGSIFTQLGDIFASWLKRKALTKDFSSIFPGHGGFMDRFDGLSFNSIVITIFAILIFA